MNALLSQKRLLDHIEKRRQLASAAKKEFLFNVGELVRVIRLDGAAFSDILNYFVIEGVFKYERERAMSPFRSDDSLRITISDSFQDQYELIATKYHAAQKQLDNLTTPGPKSTTSDTSSQVVGLSGNQIGQMNFIANGDGDQKNSFDHKQTTGKDQSVIKKIFWSGFVPLFLLIIGGGILYYLGWN